MYLELDRLSKQFDGKYAGHALSLGLEDTKMSMGALFGIVEEAEERISEKENSVAT